MKKTTLKSAVTALAFLSTLSMNAQSSYIVQKTFDFKNAKDFVVLYAPTAAVEAMGDKIISNNNLDPEMEKNQFYYWTTDWDKTELVLSNVEEENGKNSLNGTDYLNMTPLWWWGGGHFASKGSNTYDLSKVDDDMIMHIGIRSFGNINSTFTVMVGPGSKIKTNGFQLEVNYEEGKGDGDIVGLGTLPNDKKWYSIDIPIKTLIDEDGDFGFTYDFSKPIPADEPIVQIAFNKEDPNVCSKATGVLEPGNTVKTYTITKLGAAISLDGIWFYHKETTGIKNIEGNGTKSGANSAIYNLAGQKVNADYKGIVIKDGKKYMVK
ncbi:MAG: hypothetical protein ACOYJK_02005 [Prevotella sp.]|jgi:hypothetical protein